MDVSPERKQGIVQYTGMAKLTIGLAAASISFGGSNVKAINVYTRKLVFAYSIAFALFFASS